MSKKKMPKNYEEVITKAKEKSKGKENLNKLKQPAKKIVKGWDKLSTSDQETIIKLIKKFDEYVEQMREFV